MSIIGQVNQLRNYVTGDDDLYDMLHEAADTIESLSAKLQASSNRSNATIDLGEIIVDFDDRVKIYFESMDIITTARLRLENIDNFDMLVAILYDISKDAIHKLPHHVKVNLLGRELPFYVGDSGRLIQEDSKPLDYWI